MHKLAMFIPLAKADAAQRLVWGYFDETPDRANEICDYATAKPAFQAWSDGLSKASDGKNLGNIRAQHDLKKAAGKLTEITFDDETKRIGFCAKIVDDAEWKKVEERVYTGFSPGGSYAKRWQDGQYRRYTPSVGELSIVDVPCNPSATFTMVKADGTEEELEFVMAKAYEPGNEATIARSEELAKAAGPNAKSKDYVVKARADLIAENADAALEELAKAAEVVVEVPVTDLIEEVAEIPDAVAQLNAALAKGAAAVTSATPAPEAPPVEEMAKGLTELAAAYEGKEPLAKGLRGISQLSSVMYQVVACQAAVAREAAEEGDNSPVPAQIADAINTLGMALVAMAQEEVAELMADITEAGLEEEVTDWSIYECGAKIADLVKADTVLMEKAGARNSKGDAAKIQSMHDNAVSLGATCDMSAEKVESLAAENERLTKAFGDALPQIEVLTKTIETQGSELAKAAARIAELEALPAPPKGVVMVVTKEQDNGSDLTKTDANTSPLAEVIAMPNGMAKANAIIRKVGTLSQG